MTHWEPEKDELPPRRRHGSSGNRPISLPRIPSTPTTVAVAVSEKRPEEIGLDLLP